MSGAETDAAGDTTTAASAAAAAPSPAAAAAASPSLAPFAAASTKETALYYHCDEWFLRGDTRAALQSFFLIDVGAQLSEGAVDLLLCFLQRLTRWVLIRTRTLSLDQSEWDDPDSSWGSHNEFGGEGEEEVRVLDGRRPDVEWWLKRLCPRWLFADLQSHAREEMDKLKGSNLEGHPNLSCVTLWTTLPGSAALNDQPRSCYPRGDRLPAASQLFLGCALDFVVERVAERTEMMYRCVNVHDHEHGRRYTTGQHPHALEFLAEWTDDVSYFQCGVCQLYGLVNLYRCPCDSCDFNTHARCFIPRAEDNQNNTSGSSDDGAAALDGEPEKKRQRMDETGVPAGTAAASASSSSTAATAQPAAGSSSAAAPLVWGVAELSAGLLEAGVRILSDRLGMLRELGGAREAELEADPPQWQWPTEEPNNFLTPQAMEAPFDHAKSGEKPLMSNILAHIRDLLQRYAWFHDPEQIAEVKQRFLSGALAGSHPLWQQRRRVRPVAYYGRSWKPRWTIPDACIAEKVAYHNLSLKEQQEVDEQQEEDEEDLFGTTSTHGTYPCDTVAFDLIDGAGREWPLLLEYRECTYVGDVEADNAFGSLIDRRNFRTLGLIRSDEEARAVLTLQPVDAAPFFRHWTLLSAAALAEATGDEGGDLDPEGSLQPHVGGGNNGEEQWPDHWLALLHPALCAQQQSVSGGSASQSAGRDSDPSDSAAAIRPHAAAVHTQIQRLVCAAATLIDWKPKDLSMFRAFHPPTVVREFTAAVLMQRMEAADTPAAAGAAAASALAAVAAVSAVGDVGGFASSASAAPLVSHPFSHLPRDLWDIVADYAPLDLPFVALDPKRPVDAAPPAASVAPAAAAIEFIGADGQLHELIRHRKIFGSVTSLFW